MVFTPKQWIFILEAYILTKLYSEVKNEFFSKYSTSPSLNQSTISRLY